MARSSRWTKKHGRASKRSKGAGKCTGPPRASLVGSADHDRFLYARKGGAGFTDATLDKLQSAIKPLAQDKSPFDVGAPAKKAHFVKPKLVAEVEFVEWTRSGQLRAPAFKGLRSDKPPREVVREGG